MGWAWSALIGFGAGSFAWSLSAIGTHCRQPATAATLSGFVQGTGYVIALVDPFGISLLNQLSGSWTPSLILLATTGIGIGITGILAARPWMIRESPPTNSM